jgi:hypothetical protein
MGKSMTKFDPVTKPTGWRSRPPAQKLAELFAQRFASGAAFHDFCFDFRAEIRTLLPF